MRFWIETFLIAMLAASISLTGLFVWTFFRAFIHPTGRTIIDVNHFGEGIYEAIGFPIVLVGAIIAFFYILRRR